MNSNETHSAMTSVEDVHLAAWEQSLAIRLNDFLGSLPGSREEEAQNRILEADRQKTAVEAVTPAI